MLFLSKEIILWFIHHVSLCIKLSQGLVKVINTHQSMFRLLFGSKDIKRYCILQWSLVKFAVFRIVWYFSEFPGMIQTLFCAFYADWWMLDNTMNNAGIFQVFMITWKVWLYVLLQFKVIVLVKEIPAVSFIYGKHFKKRKKTQSLMRHDISLSRKVKVLKWSSYLTTCELATWRTSRYIWVSFVTSLSLRTHSVENAYRIKLQQDWNEETKRWTRRWRRNSWNKEKGAWREAKQPQVGRIRTIVEGFATERTHKAFRWVEYWHLKWLLAFFVVLPLFQKVNLWAKLGKN